jgi:hypothetical protein
MADHWFRLTSTAAWQKTWQKRTAEACRSVQEIAGRETQETLKMLKKTGFLEVRRLSQLGYGDLICKYLQNKALRHG